MNPWEKYQKQEGPWSKYASAQKVSVADWKPAESDASFIENAAAGAGKALTDPVRAVGQMLELVPQSSIDESKRLDAALMNTGGGMAGNVGANMLLSLIPGAGAANTVKGAALVGAGLSALQPTATGESRAENTLTGMALGGVGAGAAKLVGKTMSAAANKAAGIADKVKAKATADAVAETLSARSAAGRTAQEAYKQMENLTKYEALGLLTPEQKVALGALRTELMGKSADKLIPAIEAKTAAAQAYREAIASESDRAAALAAEKLSGKEAKNQIMARAKRYWPGIVTGIAGATIGGIPGAFIGGSAGLAARPMFHATRRMLQNPAVQYQALSSVADSSLLSALSHDPRYLGLLAPSIYAAQQ